MGAQNIQQFCTSCRRHRRWTDAFLLIRVRSHNLYLPIWTGIDFPGKKRDVEKGQMPALRQKSDYGGSPGRPANAIKIRHYHIQQNRRHNLLSWIIKMNPKTYKAAFQMLQKTFRCFQLEKQDRPLLPKAYFYDHDRSHHKTKARSHFYPECPLPLA